MLNAQEFWNQLNRGPAVLFLGQDYLSLETGTDPLLTEIQEKFGSSSDSPGYKRLFDGSANQDGDAALSWMSERCRRLPQPDWLQSIASFQWNSVFSSAVDPIWLQTFRNDWREVAPIYDDEYFPRDPRNRRQLHCTFLFGSLNQTEDKQRPPLSLTDFLIRKQVAVALARRLPDTLSALGVLAIEGYQGKEDWFSWEDLFPVLRSMGPGQVHLFSMHDELSRNPLVSELIRGGILVPHIENLAWTFEQGVSRGFIRLEPGNEWDSESRRVTLNNRSIPIPRDLWNKVSNSATVLDDQVLAPPAPISNDAVSWEFRRFLFECGIRPLWSGYSRRFAFPREFEEVLTAKVEKQLEQEATTDQPIVVHGQTGTGKTVALGSLAYNVAKSRNFPVIFVERRTQRPIDSDIDEYCRWMEEHGADATLIVWDGMVQPSDYNDLQGYLASRGRKAVLVGSSYKLDISNDHLVEVPDRLSAQEAIDLSGFLGKLGISLNDRHRAALAERDSTYLVALYRHLAPARRQITRGVVQELEQLEQELTAAVDHSSSTDTSLGALASAFLTAGLIDHSRISDLQRRSSAQIDTKSVAELVDLVTVPGRFGLNIPIELLARSWGMSDFADIAQLLRGFDLIHAFEDSSGRVIVGPRHPLEARLIVQARIGTIQNEADIISRIVKAMRSSIWGADESDEISFIIELLRAVGPQGSERGRFIPFLRSLSEAITEVRTSRNIRSPRLMLQEANFLREWVAETSNRGNPPEEAGEILGRAQGILREALEMAQSPQQHRLRTFIATELAANFGAATLNSIKVGASNQEIQQCLRQVRHSAATARREGFSTFYPVDILVWSSIEVAEHGGLDEATRADIVVDALDALESVDPNLLDKETLGRLERRKYELGTLLGDERLTESAFATLEALGSAAGFYLRAREIGGSFEGQNSEERRRKGEHHRAWAYLEGHRNKISHDPRCLNLLLDYWWLSNTGNRLFSSERVVPPFDTAGWLYGLGLIRELQALPEHNRGLTLSFLEALALFHTEDISQSLQLFREIEQDSYLLPRLRRILKSFLAADTDGNPRRFHGTVRRVDLAGRRGEVVVEELRRNITFFPSDFGQPGIRPGDSLAEFHIAFNFIGPIADPVSRTLT